MNSNIFLPLALCGSLASFAASAQQAPNERVYVDAGFVHIKADLGVGESTGSGLSITVDEKDSAPMLMLGYQINDQFAVEGGVIGGVDVGVNISANYSGALYGQTVVANGRLSVTGEAKESYMLGGAFTIPVNDSLSVRARAGVMWWDVDYYLSASVAGTVNGVAFSANQRAFLQSDDGNDPYYGIGMTYALSKSLALKADYMRTEIDGSDVDALSLLLSYRF